MSKQSNVSDESGKSGTTVCQQPGEGKAPGCSNRGTRECSYCQRMYCDDHFEAHEKTHA